MARKLVSQQDVYEAADEMVRAGKRPTTIGIHRMIGRGSYTTIGNYLKAWEAETVSDEQTTSSEEEEAIPESIGKDADFFVRKLWVMARKHEHAQLQAERDTLSQRETELQEEVQEVVDSSNGMQERIDELELALQESKERFDKEQNARIEAQRQCALSEASLSRAQNDLVALEEKLNTATGKYEAKLEEVATLNGHVSRLNTDVERLYHQVEQEKQQYGRLSQKQANTEASLNAEKSKNEGLQEQVRQLQQTGQEQRSELDSANAERTRLSSNNAKLTGQLEERSRQMTLLEKRLQKALESVEALKAAQRTKAKKKGDGTKEAGDMPNKQE